MFRIFARKITMKISLLVVGKTVHSYLNQGIDEYTKRISRYCPFSIQYIADAKTTNHKKPVAGTAEAVGG